MAPELAGFTSSSFAHAGTERTVYRAGTGPAVLVIAEIPGITPRVLDFARRVVDIGCTAVVPWVFGDPGREPKNGYALRTIGWACVSREFTMLATRRASPVTEWLRALARHEHEACGGPGVGAVGMCLTGGFALAMAVDDTMIAPVLSQPSLPFPFGRKLKSELGISDSGLAKVKQRCAEDGLCVLGLRFTQDRAVPPERFARLRAELGDAFIGVEIDSSSGNPHGIRKMAHSVLTEDLVDEPGHPTHDALVQVLDFLRSRLVDDADAAGTASTG